MAHAYRTADSPAENLTGVASPHSDVDCPYCGRPDLKMPSYPRSGDTVVCVYCGGTFLYGNLKKNPWSFAGILRRLLGRCP